MTAPVPAAHLTEADRTLAAEYVLGTLDAEERRSVRARIAADPHFAGLVRLWERRLSPLHELAVPVTPPPSIWRVIVADIKAAPAAASPKALRKVPPSSEPAPRPMAGEARPGRTPAPRAQGPVAAVRRMLGLAFPARATGQGTWRPKRPAPPLPPAAPPVPVALRLPGGRTLGGAIQDAVAAGLLPPAPPLPAPPLPEPSPQTATPERVERLPPPLKLAPPEPPAPPRPRPVPEPLTPPPAFIFLEPDPPPVAEDPQTTGGAELAMPAPPSTDVPAPPTFTFLDPAVDVPATAATTAGADPSAPALSVPPPTFAFIEAEAPPAGDAPAPPAEAGQDAPASPPNEVLPAFAPSSGTGFPAPGADAQGVSHPSPEPAEPVPDAAAPAMTGRPQDLAEEAPAIAAEGGADPQVSVQVSVDVPSAVASDRLQDPASLPTPPAPAGMADATVAAVPQLQVVSQFASEAVSEIISQAVPHAVGPEAAASPAPSSDARSGPVPAADAPAAGADAAPAAPSPAGLATLQPTPVEPVSAEPPSADPAAGAKGEEAPPLPGWAAVVASGVVSALPDPAAGGDDPVGADVGLLKRRRGVFPWRAATLTLLALLASVAAFAAYREWFWPRDGQWVGVLQSEPLPAIAIRLDPDSGVIFVRSFAPAPPEGEIHRLWLLVPGRPALLLGAFTAGVSGRAPALAGLGRSRLGSAEVVVTQEPKLGAAAAAEGGPPGKVVYRGRLAPE